MSEIPAFPAITSTFRDDGSVELVVQGASQVFSGSSARGDALGHLVEVAGSFGRPVRVHTHTSSGPAPTLIVSHEGECWEEDQPSKKFPVSAIPPTPPRPMNGHEQAGERTQEPAEVAAEQPGGPMTPLEEIFAAASDETGSAEERPAAPAPVEPAPAEPTPGTAVHAEPTRAEPTPTDPAPPPAPQPGPSESTPPLPRVEPEPPVAPANPPTPVDPPPAEPVGPRAPEPARPGTSRVPATRSNGRSSFITEGRTTAPAQHGWRRAMGMQPSQAELALRADVAAVSRHWPGTVTLLVANGKGSANKTPTVACLSAVFARHAGGSVLAWDNNETEGTLRYRTEWSPHEASILHLLDRVQWLLDPNASVAAINQFVHHQPADKYDTLWSDPSVDGEYIATADDVNVVHKAASRFYRMIMFDTGNNYRAANWRAAAELSDALIVPCTEREDTAEVAARMLETMHKRGGRSADLAANALIVVSQAQDGRKAAASVDRIYTKWQQDIQETHLARAVTKIPFDPALVSGVIRYDSLAPATQRAWLRAAAEVTEVL